jgi:tetratricopeptide (TPR) repeat protein
MATYDKQTIIRYVENELSGQEQLRFEAQLLQDPLLAGEVQVYRELRETLRQRLPDEESAAALKETLLEMRGRYFTSPAPVVGIKSRTLRTYLIGISAAAAILAAIFIRRAMEVNDLDSLGRTEMITVTERGNGTDTVLQQAAEYFNAEQFDKALPLLDKAAEADTSSQLALFYRGVAEWHTGRLIASRADLERVFAGGSALQYEAALYLALTYAGQKDKTAALNWLARIPAGTPVSAKAKTLTNKLQ